MCGMTSILLHSGVGSVERGLVVGGEPVDPHLPPDTSSHSNLHPKLFMHFMCQGCVQNWSALLRTQHEPKSLDQSAFMQASVSVKQHMRFAERT